MNIEKVREIAANATKRSNQRFQEIEKQLSPCYRTNPGVGRITDEQREQLLSILESVERERKATHSAA